jgi:hypothetical protein
MPINSNLPPGAEHDPRAPWLDHKLCRYCDEVFIADLAYEEVLRNTKPGEDPDATEIVNMEYSIMENAGYCSQCVAEMRADDE